MKLGRQRSRFSLIGHSGGISSREYFQRRLVHAQAHVERGQIQYPVGIVRQVIQVQR
jgi:hypothetical protein